jgi:hypothetical protein
MPSQLPVRVIIWHGLKLAGRCVAYGARFLFITFLWLGLVPWTASYFWKVNFGGREWVSEPSEVPETLVLQPNATSQVPDFSESDILASVLEWWPIRTKEQVT